MKSLLLVALPFLLALGCVAPRAPQTPLLRSWATHPPVLIGGQIVHFQPVDSPPWASPASLAHRSSPHERQPRRDPVSLRLEPKTMWSEADQPQQLLAGTEPNDEIRPSHQLLPNDSRSARQATYPLHSGDTSVPASRSPRPLATPRPAGPYRLSREQAHFLASELERMTAILSSPDMGLPGQAPEGSGAARLQPGVLCSWFDLERPETQAIYYRVLGLPMKPDTCLNRTKSEFYAISEAERSALLAPIQQTASAIQLRLEEQPDDDSFGFQAEELP